jgi:mycoredoxin
MRLIGRPEVIFQSVQEGISRTKPPQMGWFAAFPGLELLPLHPFCLYNASQDRSCIEINSLAEANNHRRLEMNETDTIILYGTNWCGGTRRCRILLDKCGIPYQWIDIEKDEEAGRFLERLNNGFRSVPTILWPDGSKLTEPTEEELSHKLGVKR